MQISMISLRSLIDDQITVEGQTIQDQNQNIVENSSPVHEASSNQIVENEPLISIIENIRQEVELSESENTNPLRASIITPSEGQGTLSHLSFDMVDTIPNAPADSASVSSGSSWGSGSTISDNPIENPAEFGLWFHNI